MQNNVMLLPFLALPTLVLLFLLATNRVAPQNRRIFLVGLVLMAVLDGVTAFYVLGMQSGGAAVSDSP